VSIEVVGGWFCWRLKELGVGSGGPVVSREGGRDSKKCPKRAMLLLSVSPSFSGRALWLDDPLGLLFVFQAFKVFERMARQDDEKRRRELEAKLRKKEEEEEAAAAAERVQICPAAHEVEVETTVEHGPAPDAGGAVGTQDSAAAPSPASAEPPGAAAPAELPT